MAAASPIQTSFNGGIFSPLLDGHIDAPRRDTSYSDSTNLIALKQGPLVRRGGTVRVFEEKLLSTGRTHLIDFIFSDEQAYILVFTNISMRVYKDGDVVFEAAVNQAVTGITTLVPGVGPPIVTVASSAGYGTGRQVRLTGLTEAVELNDREYRSANPTGTSYELFEIDGTTPIGAPAVDETSSTGLSEAVFLLILPFAESDLFDSNNLFIPDTVQSNDVMYIVQPDFAPRVLARTADDAWTLSKLKFNNGPFLTQNFSDIILVVANVSPRVWDVNVTSGDPVDIGNATQADPVVVTTSGPAHGLDDAHRVFLSGVGGMTELNGNTYNITVINSTSFSLQDLDTNVDINGTGFGAFTSGGTLDRSVSVVVPSDTLDAASGGDANDLGTATESNRQVRIQHADNNDSAWKWGRITKYINLAQFEVTIDDSAKDLVAIPDGTTEWALGAYSDTTGYPSVVSIHEGRLVTGATSDEPRRIDFSAIAGFNPVSADFIPSGIDGVIRPDDAFSVTLGGGSANRVAWIESVSQGLAVGTIVSEGLVRSSKNSESLNPENATYKKSSTAGSASIQPMVIKNALLHVQFVRRRLQELNFSFEIDGFRSIDMTELAEHLTREGIIDIAYQQQPIETIWTLLGDGSLIGFTYERNADVLGWHRHIIGGTDVDINSIAVIPSEDLSRDELWMTVTRTISGQTPRTRTYIERMERFYEDDIIQEHAFHQDSGTIYRTAEISIFNAVKANPTQVATTVVHGLSTGDNVYIRGVDGMTQLNGNTYKVTVTTTFTFNLSDPATSEDIDGTGFDAYISGGTIQESVSTFRALNYIEGETAEVYVDGRTHVDTVVAGGLVTLADGITGANVSIGLPTEWTFKSHRFETGSQLASSQGKIRRISQVIVRLLSTLGFRYGPNLDSLDEEPFTYGTDVNSMTPLFTGDKQLNWPGGFEIEGRITMKGTGPFPAQIQSIVPQIETAPRVR